MAPKNHRSGVRAPIRVWCRILGANLVFQNWNHYSKHYPTMNPNQLSSTWSPTIADPVLLASQVCPNRMQISSRRLAKTERLEFDCHVYYRVGYDGLNKQYCNHIVMAADWSVADKAWDIISVYPRPCRNCKMRLQCQPKNMKLPPDLLRENIPLRVHPRHKITRREYKKLRNYRDHYRRCALPPRP